MSGSGRAGRNGRVAPNGRDPRARDVHNGLTIRSHDRVSVFVVSFLVGQKSDRLR